MTAVGFVGLGMIGKPMALTLARSDLDLLVYDVAPEPVAELEAAGAQAVGSVAELAASVDVLCVMVRDDDQVREVAREAGPGTVLVIHSTVAPDTPAELAASGLTVVDAPVSGGPTGAAEGTLAIMVGGTDDAFAAARPALDVLGAKVVHAGPIGSGTRMKLARNMMHFVSFTAATEAMRLAEAAGLSLKDLGDVVRHTDALTGGPGAIMLRETTAPIDPADFWHGVMTHVVALGDKDLGFAIELADQLGVDVPLARRARADLATGLGL
ncbi:NAD(P)-dependent oxidoreductase [Nocardioides lianchengensis]|uniref:3-hydroxyisobutyrate dehydrogenase n=1 Tax=Nocardioides lianchengensis TaxID=1045774 RepID=A0A1G6RB65_9ACTN|nr:NAD(P)-dependent oxidoreductase [Nocardioides lianchengensis]NYG10300.1 3-hydroxyisobutyrate dehydrogenase [Nocardioides lianchengensis]SDD01681.1 3-hydroxyisobutyrate dehydrogenase [Nocardioides lianchengensis]